MMLRFVFLLFISLPRIAAAQEIDPIRFTPLAIGDRWEYAHTRQELPRDGDPGPEVLVEYITTEVARDTVIGSEPYLVLVRRAYDADGVLTDSMFCTARVLDNGSVIYPYPPHSEEMCTRLSALNSQYSLPFRDFNGDCYRTSQTYVPGVVPVRGEDYEVPATTRCTIEASHGNGWSLFYAADLGLFRWQYDQLPSYRGGDGFKLIYHLTYAEVGGETYGVSPPWAAEPAFPASPAALTLDSPFPNPTIGDTRFAVWGAEQGEAAMKVFDAAGRLVRNRRVGLRGQVVLQGNADWVTVDTRGLPAGVYVARITDAAGRSGSVSLVKLQR